ncbi:MAG: 3-deoxy-7-phosphoheptulonate synthase [Bacillota bacterium]|nr:3-deoxy-7-phosphoheptulonate synthase [Bacillota bacterium]
MNAKFKRKLPTPEEIKAMYPLDEELAARKAKNDAEIQAIFRGESDKLLLIIGPCSADREDAVIEYISRLRKLADQISDVIVCCPRIYTNKPRTTGLGYKGMLHQPNPHAKPDMLRGLIAIRHLHIRALRETGFSCADEMLYPENHRYLSDVLSYVAVGARSVEDQMHRLTASSLDIPVGMKNPTSGDLKVMMNAVKAAINPQTFIYGGWEVESQGNPLAHVILRGYVDKDAENYPNYHYEDLEWVAGLYEKGNYPYPGIIVDCNHSNSDKKFYEQPRIALEVLHSMNSNPKIGKIVKGLMIESYLEDGCQDPDGGVYGLSITDPCLGWEKTEKLLLELADIRRGR